ncbi:MAG: ribbon-helix-helix domain-containing protein [Actinomycetota bacterium]|jgi:predicted transcriptional regulator|nr:ribbon-helix-helix protein, CopG family [Euzebyaceae bacterium]MDQ3453720.1 ribbon-helix-helix domain-containing protein [Actinomycetota bacterium]
MHRTTVYLEPELEMRLRAEAQRRDAPMATIIREALREKFGRESSSRSSNAGRFSSGHSDTGSRADEVLEEGGFGRA